MPDGWTRSARGRSIVGRCTIDVVGTSVAFRFGHIPALLTERTPHQEDWKRGFHHERNRSDQTRIRVPDAGAARNHLPVAGGWRAIVRYAEHRIHGRRSELGPDRGDVPGRAIDLQMRVRLAAALFVRPETPAAADHLAQMAG